MAITSAIIKYKINIIKENILDIIKLGVFASITFSLTPDEAMLG